MSFLLQTWSQADLFTCKNFKHPQIVNSVLVSDVQSSYFVVENCFCSNTVTDGCDQSFFSVLSEAGSSTFTDDSFSQEYTSDMCQSSQTKSQIGFNTLSCNTSNDNSLAERIEDQTIHQASNSTFHGDILSENTLSGNNQSVNQVSMLFDDNLSDNPFAENIENQTFHQVSNSTFHGDILSENTLSGNNESVNQESMLFETNLSVIPVSKHFETTDAINQDNILPTDDTNQENILMTDDKNQDNFLPDSFKSRQVVEQLSNITVLCDMSDSPESSQSVNQVQSFLCDTLADELIPTNCESSQIVKQVSSSTLLCDTETDELLECPESSHLMNQVSNKLLFDTNLSVIPVAKHFETTDALNHDIILPTDDTNQDNILSTDDTNQDNILPDSFKSRSG